MRRARVQLIGVLLSLSAACETTGEATATSELGEPCAWIAGRWAWDGCGEDVCTFFEDHCQIHYECSSRSNSIVGSGSIEGNVLTFGGGYCTAQINGKMMSGSCSAPQACAFTATHP